MQDVEIRPLAICWRRLFGRACRMTRTHWLIFFCGSLIAFVWEIFQMPFFKPGNLETYEQTIRCGIASLGDGVILLTAYSLAALRGGTDAAMVTKATSFPIVAGRFGVASSSGQGL